MPTGIYGLTTNLLGRASLALDGCSRPRKLADPPSISKLGDDLLEEILIRLPNPRSASRCKPVCKLWNSLISNPSFNRRFVSHHQSRIEAEGEPTLLLPSDDPLSTILSFLPVPDEIRSEFVIWDCFKDLLLCGFQTWSRGELSRLFLICNPFTKQWVTLPLSPVQLNSYYGTTTVKLVCAEARNPNSLDLGDGQTFKYSDYRFRVLVGYAGTPNGGSELHVFSSESRKWSTGKRLRLPPNTISLNGKIYRKLCHIEKEEIQCFDPFRLNKPPVPSLLLMKGNFVGDRRRRISHLSASNGAPYMSVLEQYPNGREAVLKVRTLEEGSNRWRVCYRTPLKTLKCNGGGGPEVDEDLEIDSVLAQHPRKPEVFFLKCFRNHTEKEVKKEGVIFSWDFKTRKFDKVTDYQVRCNVLRRWMVFQPETTCFSTPIPSYEKLLDMYKGSYGDLVLSRKLTY